MAGYRKLGRTSDQRKAMLRSQVTNLLYHGKIVTTEARAKEVKKIAEGIIALAVKEKDNFETVKVTAKVARKDKDGKRVKEVVDGKKVKAIGTDGADGSDGNDGTDGTNGKDGITPKFKIDGGYWYISYDNEQSWNRLGKATGDSGLNGDDGDAFFKGVSMADGFVIFTLNDAESTKIKIPFYSETVFRSVEQPKITRNIQA